ncbi:hypothetical protein MAE02_54560 [Microvirga aerophila]|uniref:Uncharacterized protein n=1 Tax=Microvirga aerophila TaxID=670291 RepID=A0A512C0N6_9HYPH|nr:hypothetical protein MAE02_54560 [Microvirga aerophila]
MTRAGGFYARKRLHIIGKASPVAVKAMRIHKTIQLELKLRERMNFAGHGTDQAATEGSAGVVSPNFRAPSR